MSSKTDPLLQADAKGEGEKKDEDKFEVARAAGSVAFFCEVNDQMMTVFLAPYFMMRGINQAQVGSCYFSLSCGFLLGFPISRALLKRYPPNMVQYYAGFAFVLVRYVMGTIAWVPDDDIFPCGLVICLVVGLIASVIEGAGGAWVMVSYDHEDRTDAQSVLISTRVSGNVVAPFVGGTLYTYGGFPVTFFVGATAFLLYLIWKKNVLLSYKPKLHQEASQTGSILKDGLCLGIVFLNFVALTLFFTSQSWLTSFFHFNYDCPIFVVGTLLSSLVIPFGITAISMPTLQKKLGYWNCVYGAVLLGGLGNLFIGPSPLVAWFLPEPSLSTVWVPILACYTGGILWGTCLPIWLPLLTNAAVMAGFDEQNASAQASTLTVVQAGVAMGLGPVVSGNVVNLFGVPVWTTVLSALLIFALIPLICCIQFLDNKRPKSATAERRPSQMKGKGAEA